MLELLCFLLLTSSSTGAPVTLESSTPLQMTTSAPVYQASINSLHDVEGPIEDTSNSLVNLDHHHAGSVGEDSSFISLPSSSSIPPRFKYMEEQIAQKKDDLVDVEYSTTEDHTSVSPDSSTSPLPPRYNYMEEQLGYKKEVFEEDSESSSVTHPTTPTTVQQSTDVTTRKIPSSSEVPTTFSLPPRFKYMEEQLAHKKQDLEEEENYEASRETMSTTVPAMGDQRTEEMLISPEVSTSFPIPPRFKYMEAQISESQESGEEKIPDPEATTSYQTTISTDSPLTPTKGSQTTPRIPYPEHEDAVTDTVELHKQNPFLSGGFLPGPEGFVRKTKRVSEEEKQRMMKEMEVHYGPVMEDIKAYGFILKRENDKLSAEVQVLRGELIKTESELVDVKLKKQMSWLPFWN